jgi:hypothetical protein
MGDRGFVGEAEVVVIRRSNAEVEDVNPADFRLHLKYKVKDNSKSHHGSLPGVVGLDEISERQANAIRGTFYDA